MDVERELLDYISTEIAYDRALELQPDDSLLDGAIDSTDMLRLVVFVEERFGIQLADEDFLPENFGTVASLASLVQSRRGG